MDLLAGMGVGVSQDLTAAEVELLSQFFKLGYWEGAGGFECFMLLLNLWSSVCFPVSCCFGFRG